MAARPVHALLAWCRDFYDSHPAPHAETHLFTGGSDPLQAPGTPTTIQAGAVGAAGTGPSAAAEDHVHPVSTGAPVALGDALAEGSGAALARASHVHARAIRVFDNAAGALTRRDLDLVDTASVTWTTVDDAGNDRVQVKADVAAPVVITPAQISADQNDYDPGEGTVADAIVRLSSDAARTITGFLARPSGSRRTWVNVGAFAITLAEDAAASAAANRMLAQGVANVVLPSRFTASAWYDGVSSRWRVHAE